MKHLLLVCHRSLQVHAVRGMTGFQRFSISGLKAKIRATESVTRRLCVREAYVRCLLVLSVMPYTASVMLPCRADDGAVEIGSRRELFVDSVLMESLSGSAVQKLHHPQVREVALDHDAAWEGTGSGYHSVFRDGDRYRMYYKAWHLDVADGKVRTGTHPLYCCYAESDDGVHWRKPELGLVDFRGSKANNIVMAPESIGDVTSDPGHPAVFKDENPDCPDSSRYKAVIRASKPHGLLIFHSADGLSWSLMHPKPVITNGAFDSQNLAFFDPNIGAYRAYWRYFTGGRADGEKWEPSGHRAIRTAVSTDLIHWTEEKDLQYVDSPSAQLYTNVVKPSHRAPQLLLGFPTRYVERGWSDSMRQLPERDARDDRARASARPRPTRTRKLSVMSKLRFAVGSKFV